MQNNDMLNSLKGLLGDNADEKIGAVMNALSGNNDKPINVEDDISVDNSFSQPDQSQYISQIKNIIGELSNATDSRSNLLLSLRPYMRDNRKKSIDNLIKVLNISKFSGLFK